MRVDELDDGEEFYSPTTAHDRAVAATESAGGARVEVSGVDIVG